VHPVRATLPSRRGEAGARETKICGAARYGIEVGDSVDKMGRMTMTPSNAAVILLAHGERGGAFSNAVLLGHAERIAAGLTRHHVGAGVLSGEPTLEAAMTAAAGATAGPLIIYPFFMASGFFVNVRIPERIGALGLADRCRILAPLSAAERLPALIRDAAAEQATRLGLDPRASRLLLVGHGSKGSRASAEATTMVAACLREIAGFRLIQTAFLEEAPFLDEAVASVTMPTVVVGFFNGDGLHARDDVPAALASYGAPITYTGAVGAMPGVSEIIRGEVDKVLD
jgi:sirohydrochlorin ferrochelatase